MMTERSMTRRDALEAGLALGGGLGLAAGLAPSSAEAATQGYLDRIAAVDDAGPTLNAVLAINPGAYARLAALYFLVGIVVILIRGIVTQWITQLLIKRGGHEERFAEFDVAYASGHFQGGLS